MSQNMQKERAGSEKKPQVPRWWLGISNQCKTLNWIAFDNQFPVQIAAVQVPLKALL